MHFCHEELMALLVAIPGLSLLVARIRGWWHARFGCGHPKRGSTT